MQGDKIKNKSTINKNNNYLLEFKNSIKDMDLSNCINLCEKINVYINENINLSSKQ